MRPMRLEIVETAATRRARRKEFLEFVTHQLTDPSHALSVERHHPIIENFGCGDRGLAIIELGKGDFGGRAAPASACGAIGDGIRPRKSGSHPTPRWRERDSNRRSSPGLCGKRGGRRHRCGDHKARPVSAQAVERRRSGRRLRNQSLWFGASAAASRSLRPSTHATSRQCHRDCGPVRRHAGIQSSPAA